MKQDHPHRRPSLRLQGYDYSQAGMYFVTIVTQDRLYLLGEVSNGEMHLNQSGRIVKWVWSDLPLHYRNLELGAFVVMPNHVHGIVILNDSRRGGSVLANPSGVTSEDLGKSSRSETTETHPYGEESISMAGRGGFVLAKPSDAVAGNLN
jgi:REP element-mobilizing transposase RayT